MGASIDSRGSTHWWRTVLAVVAAGLVLRLAFVVFEARFDQPVGDQLFYSAQALANSEGRWFEQPFARGEPAADHPPFTALVLTPVSWLAEREPFGSWVSLVTAQRLFMPLIGVIGMIAVALIGRRVAGDRVGVVAAVISALYANIWVNDGLLMAESATFALVGTMILAALWFLRRPDPQRVAVLGATSGLAALTRPELLLTMPMIAVFVATVLWPSRRRVVTSVLTSALACSIVVLPWVVWNNLRFDAPVLLSTNDGLTLAGAHCDRTYYDDVGGWDIWCAYATEIPVGDDASEASRRMRADGLDYWRTHLDRYPVVAAARVARVASIGFFGASARAGASEGRPEWVSHLGALQYWVSVPLAVLGWRRLGRGAERRLLVAAVPVVLAVTVFANAFVRFRVPAEVGLVVLASVGVTHLIDRWGERRRPGTVSG